MQEDVAEPDDAQLLAMIANGCNESTEKFIERHSVRLRSILSQRLRVQEIEDAFQVVCARIARSAHTFDGRRSKGPAWITTITVNVANDTIRRRVRDEGMQIEVKPWAEQHESPADALSTAEKIELDVRKIAEGLAQLPARDQDLLELWARDGSIAGVANAFGLSYEAAKKAVSRAKARLFVVLKAGEAVSESSMDGESQ